MMTNPDPNLPVASVGPDVPPELLAATGRSAGPLGWNIDREFPRAAQWLESKYPRWAFSIVEDWASGALDHLGAVVFSRADDAAQRLYYYLCELRRRGAVAGPQPLILDIARIGRPSSEGRCIEAVRHLAGQLGVADDALETAIAVAPASPPAVSTVGNVCLLAGTPAPDRRLHDAVAANGWTAVGETLAEIWARCPAPAEAGTSDPCAALGRRMHAQSSGPRAFFDRGAKLVEQARAANAQAVVLWYAEEDEADVWHLPTQKRALAEAGIPALVLTRRDWRANDGAAEEIAVFLKEQGA